MAFTKKQKAKKKYREKYGVEPTDSQLSSFISSLPASTFSDCVDYGGGAGSTYHGGYCDSGSSYSSSDSGGGFSGCD